jgi:hypothetical protein
MSVVWRRMSTYNEVMGNKAEGPYLITNPKKP